jgi:general secretion pathway protein E
MLPKRDHIGSCIVSDAPDIAVDSRFDRVAQSFVERVPIHFARRYTLLGLATDDPAVIEIVTDEAAHQPSLENLALTLGCEVRMVLADAGEIQRAINAAYQQQAVDVAGVAAQIDAPADVEIDGLEDEGDLLDNASRAPVIRLVNLMLFEAAQRRASDVHVQPLEGGLVIRLRVDGVLVDYLQPSPHLHDEIVSRIKIMGGMDIAEQRLPQDGRATVRIGERLIDLRIATLPTAHGERVVLRLLDKGARLYDLADLGMAPDVLHRFGGLIGRAHGMILMTGPTGSGKSTTLYAALQRINYRELNVVTLEDPIEYHLSGISQTQVSTRKGMTFAAGLRSILRQDPDIIMVGEIRDTETARLAIQSALTGHLVLSTLHTNDAAGAVARLLDLGIEPYLVADSLLAVGAQRLVRLLCPDCKAPTSPNSSEIHELGLSAADLDRVWCGRGCPRCNGSGHYEREGLFELLVVEERLRGLIHDRAPAGAIRAAAVAGGMRTLRQDGVRKIRAGLTSPAEVLRVTRGFEEGGSGVAPGAGG